MSFPQNRYFWFNFFFFILYFQPNLHGTSEQNNYNKKILTIFLGKFKRHSFFVNSTISLESNLYHQLSFFFFIICALYTTSFLPYGRFFNRIGGNWGFLGSYFFLFFYLSFYWLRKPLFLEIYIIYLYQISCYLKIYSKKIVIWPENIY